MGCPNYVVYLEGSSGARRRITSDIIERSAFIQGMIDFGVARDDDISVRVPLDEHLLDPVCCLSHPGNGFVLTHVRTYPIS